MDKKNHKKLTKWGEDPWGQENKKAK